MNQKELPIEKPKTTRVSNPISVAIHRVTTVMDGLDEANRQIVLDAIVKIYHLNCQVREPQP